MFCQKLLNAKTRDYLIYSPCVAAAPIAPHWKGYAFLLKSVSGWTILWVLKLRSCFNFSLEGAMPASKVSVFGRKPWTILL